MRGTDTEKVQVAYRTGAFQHGNSRQVNASPLYVILPQGTRNAGLPIADLCHIIAPDRLQTVLRRKSKLDEPFRMPIQSTCKRYSWRQKRRPADKGDPRAGCAMDMIAVYFRGMLVDRAHSQG